MSSYGVPFAHAMSCLFYALVPLINSLTSGKTGDFKRFSPARPDVFILVALNAQI